MRQRRKTAKNVGSGTQTIALIKQPEKSLGPVDLGDQTIFFCDWHVTHRRIQKQFFISRANVGAKSLVAAN